MESPSAKRKKPIQPNEGMTSGGDKVIDAYFRPDKGRSSKLVGNGMGNPRDGKRSASQRIANIQKKVSEQITSTDKNAKRMYEGPTMGLEERAGRNRASAGVAARKSALKKMVK